MRSVTPVFFRQRTNSLEIRIDAGDTISVSDPVDNVNIDTSVPGTTVYTIYSDATQTTELAELTVVAV